MLEAPADTPLGIYGDGSGGKRSTDWRYRRCGWAWARLTTTTDGNYQLASARYGPQPSRRQTNNRAELWALLDC
eukprot:7495560-Pyramimonas_sp.AAC.1